MKTLCVFFGDLSWDGSCTTRADGPAQRMQDTHNPLCPITVQGVYCIYIYTDVEGLFLNMMVPEDLMDQVQSPLKKEAKEDDNRL